MSVSEQTLSADVQRDFSELVNAVAKSLTVRVLLVEDDSLFSGEVDGVA